MFLRKAVWGLVTIFAFNACVSSSSTSPEEPTDSSSSTGETPTSSNSSQSGDWSYPVLPAGASKSTVESWYTAWNDTYFITYEDQIAMGAVSVDFEPLLAGSGRITWDPNSMCAIDGITDANKMRGCTVSEGIGYGMLIAYFQKDWDTFHRLWKYSKYYRYSEDIQLTSWMTLTFRWNPLDRSSATDADLDIATALLLASYDMETENPDRATRYKADAIEIAKAISFNSKIIVMDEPSATLTDHELAALFDLIKTLRRQGIGILYISHRLEEIFEMGNRVTVMRDGTYVGTHDVAALTRDEIIRMMVGRELKDEFPKEVFEPGAENLRVEGLTRNGVFRDVSFSVRAGEVVGLTGLVGAGRTEVARAIFGADRIDGGQIFLAGKPVTIRSPQDAIARGIGLLTEDRKGQGLVLGMSVRDNTTMANLSALVNLLFINHKRERAITEKYISELQIKTPSTEQMVQNLSGGNQQKVVLAKWLYTQSRVLIFDEPTRGIDVGAKVEIYKLMNELARQGVCILMISSELPEILGMCDRILVMHEGKIAGELAQGEATQEGIMRLATGERLVSAQ
ncbi:MAG: Ribose import ATP-binding protein RbsA [Candidatus Hydrogenedentes bacterium ADurb.Bin179]|nr:MAG: Ribose import ATP-binding protein RbsA [Candidatus Hydrogenedentes bacterium ADurb.Bin179]